MEVSLSNVSNYGEDEKALTTLMEAFGSVLSIKQIASAYCKAGRNADLAGQMLSSVQTSSSGSSTYASDEEEKCEESLLSSNSDTSDKSLHVVENLNAPRQKLRPVSGGTISSVLGKDYFKPVAAVSGSSLPTKFMKADERMLLSSEIWGEANKASPPNDNYIHKEMEDFLFKMLGNGFQLQRDAIGQVLDKCGYDMKKSMEKLVDLSSMSLDERTDSLGESTEMFRDACPNSKELLCEEKLQSKHSSGDVAKVSGTHKIRIPQQGDERRIQKEVLSALFSSAKRYESSSREEARAARRSRIFGKPVVQPPSDSIFENKDEAVTSQQDIKNYDNEEDEYQLLRRAVKEHRSTMKEYYKAAVDAFQKGDHERADKLMDQGHFYHKKACEADEESSRKIFEIKNGKAENDMLLDLHDLDTREARRLLRYHLSSLCGITSIKCLKVIIERNEAGITKGGRRKTIIKLLDKESIKWTESGEAGSILIRLDNVDPDGLSFTKK